MSRARLEAEDAAEEAALADGPAYVQRHLYEASRHRPGLSPRELMAALDPNPDHEEDHDVV